jgi:hypothetical protein
MKLYRINKMTKPGGVVLKKKDVLAASDKEAVQKAADSQDCPVCEILKDGQQVGSIVQSFIVVFALLTMTSEHFLRFSDQALGF